MGKTLMAAALPSRPRPRPPSFFFRGSLFRFAVPIVFGVVCLPACRLSHRFATSENEDDLHSQSARSVEFSFIDAEDLILSVHNLPHLRELNNVVEFTLEKVGHSGTFPTCLNLSLRDCLSQINGQETRCREG